MFILLHTHQHLHVCIGKKCLDLKTEIDSRNLQHTVPLFYAPMLLPWLRYCYLFEPNRKYSSFLDIYNDWTSLILFIYIRILSII